VVDISLCGDEVFATDEKVKAKLIGANERIKGASARNA
jgi:hypothetical protein